jgi:hypothetical protein
MVMSTGKTEVLRNNLRRLTSPIGEVGMPLCNISFSDLRMPINMDKPGTELVQGLNSDLAKAREGGETVISGPQIESTILLISSNSDNLAGNFPSESELKANAAQSSENPENAEVFINNPTSRKFTLSCYWVFGGLYLWRLRPTEPPIMRDLEFLASEYANRSSGDYRDKLYRHHTLFYNDYRVLTGLTGEEPRRKDAVGIRNYVTDFWASYEPSTSSVKTWGSIVLGYILDSTDRLQASLDDFEDALHDTLSQKDPSKWELLKLKTARDKLTANLVSAESTLHELQSLYAIIRSIRTTLLQGSTDIRNVIEAQDKAERSLIKISDRITKNLALGMQDYEKRLSQFPDGDRIAARGIERVREMLTEVEKRANNLADQIQTIVSKM